MIKRHIMALVVIAALAGCGNRPSDDPVDTTLPNDVAALPLDDPMNDTMTAPDAGMMMNDTTTVPDSPDTTTNYQVPPENFDTSSPPLPTAEDVARKNKDDTTAGD